MTIISESGLYRLVMKSRLPQAEEFQDWVEGEVLPTLRKQGYYIDNENKAVLWSEGRVKAYAESSNKISTGSLVQILSRREELKDLTTTIWHLFLQDYGYGEYKCIGTSKRRTVLPCETKKN